MTDNTLGAYLAAMNKANDWRTARLAVAIITGVFEADAVVCRPGTPCGDVVVRHMQATDPDAEFAARLASTISGVYTELGVAHDPAAVRAQVDQRLALAPGTA